MSSTTACRVCAAKLAGRAPPRRKCTCDSGLTSNRNRASAPTSDERSSDCLGIAYDLNDRDDATSLREIEGTDGQVHAVMGDNPEAADFWSFDDQITTASEVGDVAAVQSLLANSDVLGFAERYASSFEWTRRVVLGNACCAGSVPLVTFLLDDGGPLGKMQVLDRCFTVDAKETALPIRVAAGCGQCDLVQLLIARGADVNAAASDGTTSCYAACEVGSVSVLRLLHASGADMQQADQDGTAPVHIAAACGHLEVLKFLQEHGVDMDARGGIFLGVDGTYRLHTGVNPLMIAQRQLASVDKEKAFRAQPVLQFLESLKPPVQTTKRERSAVPIHERAALLGVVNRLNSIPPSLYVRIENGSEAERASAKKELHKLQKANQQIVSRAEQSRLKQTKLC